MRCRYSLMLCIIIFFCVCLLTGCETLRKKFTRKRKNVENREDVVIVPRDYDQHPFPPDVLYKQYFSYWKAWNQELMQSLSAQESYKRIMSSSQQAVANLKKMSSYLTDEKAGELNVYVGKLEKIDAEIKKSRNLPPERMRVFRYKVSRIYSCVNREYDFTRMKTYLKQDKVL